MLAAAALAVAAGAALAARARTDAAPMLPGFDFSTEGAPADEAQQDTPGFFDQITMTLDPRQLLPLAVDADTAARNVRAFLTMLKVSEGTAGRGDDGYNVSFGGSTFDSYADHPRIARQFRDRAGRLLWTSAAGAYQFMARSPLPGGGSTRVETWDRLAARLSLPDFGPASQDAAAVELIREAGALRDVQAGRLADAVARVRTIWASLPGAGYQQAERTYSQLASAYQAAGGFIESQA